MKLSKIFTSIALVSLLGASLTGCDAVAGVAGDALKDTLNSGTDASADANTDAKTVDLSKFAPSGETFFQNTDKEAGSFQGSGNKSVVVTVKGDKGMMWVVDTDSEDSFAVNGPDGARLQFATETLGGKPFVPVYVENVGALNVTFAHRVKAGECNNYVAEKDGDVYAASLKNTAPCSY